MGDRLGKLLGQPKLILTIAFLMLLVGVVSWMTMIRQEDPFFPYRYAVIVTPFPGADVERIDKLVVKPLEEEIAELAEVFEMWSTVRTGYAVTVVSLKRDIYDTDPVWDRVRDAMTRAEAKFPAGVLKPTLDDKATDNDAIVLAVTGSSDLVALAAAAEKLKTELLKLRIIDAVNTHGDAGDQVTIRYEEANLARLGLAPGFLKDQLEARNRSIPGGTLNVDGKTLSLRPQSDFETLTELQNTPITLASGQTLPLSAFATVIREPAQPLRERMWWKGQPAVLLALVLPHNNANTVEVGDKIRVAVQKLKPQFAPLRIEEMFYQPDWVKYRLSDLGSSLLSGTLLLGFMLMVAMGWRVGLIVSAVVPLSNFAAIAVYAMGGGVLHQISIAALVIGLGMLVDNAIVMVEEIQRHINEGKSQLDSAILAVKDLAGPLGASTGTTVASYLPMLMAKGESADFTRAVPIIIIMTTVISYLFALTVTPVLGQLFLRKRLASTEGFPERWGEALAKLIVKNPVKLLGISVLLVVAAGALAPLVKIQFFPSADRNEVVIDLTYPEGTHLDTTTAGTQKLLNALYQEKGKVTDVHAFIGTSGPKFYYNMISRPNAPHFSRLVVETIDVNASNELIPWVRQWAKLKMPDAMVTPRRLNQGPPMDAPIEVRLKSEDPALLARATEQVYQILNSIPGTVDVEHDLGTGLPSLRYEVNDAVAARYGLSRTEVAAALLSTSFGLPAGEFRGAEEPLPIRIRSRQGEDFLPENLSGINVYSRTGQVIPLAQLVTTKVEWQPGAIRRKDLSRMNVVSSWLMPGVAFNQVLKELEAKLAKNPLPKGVTLEQGGEAENAGEANAGLAAALPIGLLLMLFFLLLEFNSFLKIVLVIIAIPLGIVGIIPGLVFSGAPFGFSSMLGLFTLMGVILNNAIVLVDVIERQIEAGLGIREAIIEGIRRRTRPIALTAITTLAGLIPLTWSSSGLWPPMAWTIIAGLATATFMTPLVIGGCYMVLYGRKADANVG